MKKDTMAAPAIGSARAPATAMTALERMAAPPPAKKPRLVEDAGQDHASGGSAFGGSLDLTSLGKPPELPPLGSHHSEFEKYYTEMVLFVRSALPLVLAPLGVKIKAVTDAFPTRIAENLSAIGRNTSTTFRPQWGVAECVQAMSTTGLYESAGSIWWFDAASQKVMFQGEEIIMARTPWCQVEAAMSVWSWERYLASSESPPMRRLIFPMPLPTACHSINEAQHCICVSVKGQDGEACTEDRPFFEDLPMVAGRAHVLALCQSMYDCMKKWHEPSSQTLLLKIWEACYENSNHYLE